MIYTLYTQPHAHMHIQHVLNLWLKFISMSMPLSLFISLAHCLSPSLSLACSVMLPLSLHTHTLYLSPLSLSLCCILTCILNFSLSFFSSKFLYHLSVRPSTLLIFDLSSLLAFFSVSFSQLEQHGNSTFGLTRGFKAFDKDSCLTIDKGEMKAVLSNFSIELSGELSYV